VRLVGDLKGKPEISVLVTWCWGHWTCLMIVTLSVTRLCWAYDVEKVVNFKHVNF